MRVVPAVRARADSVQRATSMKLCFGALAGRAADSVYRNVYLVVATIGRLSYKVA